MAADNTSPGALLNAALSALKAVAEDGNAPASARVQAAAAILNHVDPGAGPGAGKPLADMSLDEIDAALAAFSRPPAA